MKANKPAILLVGFFICLLLIVNFIAYRVAISLFIVNWTNKGSFTDYNTSMSFQSPVSELLFKQPYGKAGNPLFDSQTDLVDAIINANGSPWKDKKFRSVRAFVNQVVNGERKLSDKLKMAIGLVLPERLHPKHNPEQVMETISQTFDDFFREKRLYKQQAYTTPFRHAEDANDFYLLEKRGLLADSVVITTRETMVVPSGKWSNEIRKQMLIKIGLLPSEEKNTTPANYTFFFPTPDANINRGFQFWQSLYETVKYEFKIPKAEALLEKANEEGRIRIYLAPPLLCSYPIVAYDLYALSEVAFTVFGYQDKGQEKVSTARISPRYLNWWKEDIYSLLSKEGNDKVEALPFNKILPDIIKNEALS